MTEPKRIEIPLSEADARALRVGVEVLLSGTFITARDQAHRYLAQRAESDELPPDLSKALIYHCGPIVRQTPGGWHVVSAGPTTSNRMEMYESQVIGRYGVRGILGKGGMGEATAETLADFGAVYFAAPGGLGALLADKVEKVAGVWKLEEFGVPEALWQLEVKNFPAVVAMDAAGGDLYRRVLQKSTARFEALKERVSHQKKSGPV